MGKEETIWHETHCPFCYLNHSHKFKFLNMEHTQAIFFFFFLTWWSIYLFSFGCVGSSFLWGLSLVVASGGHSSSRCTGLSLSRPLLLRSTGSRCAGSVVVAHGPSCSAACGIFPGQGSNPCPLHWQADSQPLRHQGSPCDAFWCVDLARMSYSPKNSVSSLFPVRVGILPGQLDSRREALTISWDTHPSCLLFNPTLT